jgi:hypothetical protein
VIGLQHHDLLCWPHVTVVQDGIGSIGWATWNRL